MNSKLFPAIVARWAKGFSLSAQKSRDNFSYKKHDLFYYKKNSLCVKINSMLKIQDAIHKF